MQVQVRQRHNVRRLMQPEGAPEMQVALGSAAHRGHHSRPHATRRGRPSPPAQPHSCPSPSLHCQRRISINVAFSATGDLYLPLRPLLFSLTLPKTSSLAGDPATILLWGPSQPVGALGLFPSKPAPSHMCSEVPSLLPLCCCSQPTLEPERGSCRRGHG